MQWVRGDVWLTVKGEFYDAKGELWKRLEAKDVREVDRAAKKWIAHNVRMEDLRAGRVSVLQLGEVRANVDIEDSVFTEQNLSTE